MPPVTISGGLPGSTQKEEFEAFEGQKRMIGPEIPPEFLHQTPQEPEDSDIVGASDSDSGFVIGPVPLEIGSELGEVSDDARAAEVNRVLRAVEKETPGTSVDAYEVLGIDPDAANREIKKKYWKVSLLVHPDKCGHPKAQQHSVL